MDKSLKLPLDFESWPEMRRLRGVVGDAAAVYLLVKFWAELGQLGQMPDRGKRLGWMGSEEAELFYMGMEAPAADGPGGMAAMMGQLARCGLATPEDGGWMCGRFAKVNPHLDANFQPMHMKGAEASRYKRGVAKFHGVAAQLSLQVPEEVWTRPDGGKMDHEEVRRVMVLIRMVDGALGKGERPATGAGYTEGLVQDAYRVVTGYLAEQTEGVCQWLLEHRGRAGVPTTTEAFLARWEEFARARK